MTVLAPRDSNRGPLNWSITALSLDYTTIQWSNNILKKYSSNWILLIITVAALAIDYVVLVFGVLLFLPTLTESSAYVYIKILYYTKWTLNTPQTLFLFSFQKTFRNSIYLNGISEQVKTAVSNVHYTANGDVNWNPWINKHIHSIYFE